MKQHVPLPPGHQRFTWRPDRDAPATIEHLSQPDAPEAFLSAMDRLLAQFGLEVVRFDTPPDEFMFSVALKGKEPTPGEATHFVNVEAGTDRASNLLVMGLTNLCQITWDHSWYFGGVFHAYGHLTPAQLAQVRAMIVGNEHRLKLTVQGETEEAA